MSKAYRVLLIAEAANPEWVSVPLVGWSHALALSNVARTHLVTQVRNREAIERYGWRHGEEFTAIDSEAVAKAAYSVAGVLRGGKGKGWTVVSAMASPSYLYFERLFWQRFGAELQAGKWDIVHRITPLSPTIPSLLGGRLRAAGVPYVVGPLNGGVPWPKEFDAARRAEKEWLSYVRDAYKLLPGYRALRKEASAIVCGSEDTLRQMPSWTSERLAYIPENAIDPQRFERDSPSSAVVSDQPLHVAFIGRLVPYKGADMLVEAAAPLVRDGLVRVTILGDGPERGKLERLIAEQQLEHGVVLHGWVHHQEVSKKLVGCDVLGFPSVREFGGGVVLEAMAMGLVPVVLAYGGPKELVTDQTGIALALGNRADIVQSLRAALQKLAGDRALVRELSIAAQARVARYFTWEKKALQTLAIYDWVTGNGKLSLIHI